MNRKKILITGAAGFIGYHLSLKLLNLGYDIVGLDNLNDYYDVNLKLDRLNQLGIAKKSVKKNCSLISSNLFGNSFQFICLSIQNKRELYELFTNKQFDIVCNLAAQAGVRYSLENPNAYVESNVMGFLNILEASKKFNIKHLIYASSSSVYGDNKRIPFSTTDQTDSPLSVYAATKKSNELMAYVYSQNFKLLTTGLRFFTVYGPWGRPDMAMFLFTDAILNNKPIKVFNNGDLERDFTYIDDIVEGITKIIDKNTTNSLKNNNLYRLYNIGNNNSIKLLDFINTIENEVGLKAKKEFLPMQTGDVEKTWANVDALIRDYNYKPSTPIKKGVSEFVKWYLNYYKVSLPNNKL